MSTTKLWSKNYILVCFGIFFIFSNFYILMSTMPLALQKNMNADAKMMSWVVSIYSLGIVLMRPFTGLLADKFGKRKVAVVTFLLFSLCSIAYFGINSLYVLLVLRFMHGVFHSIATTAHGALAVDLSPANLKGQGIAYYGLAMCLAMVVAPALGIYVLEHYSYEILLAIAGVMALMAFVVTLFIDRKEQSFKVDNEPFTLNKFLEFNVFPIGISSFLISFCYSAIIAFIAVYLTDLKLDNAAIYFYIAFALSMIISRPLVGKFIDEKPIAMLAYPSLVVFALGMVLLAFSATLSMVLLAGVVLGLSYGAIFPCLQTIAIKAAPAHRSGAAIATFFIFYDCGFGIGAVVLAYVVKSFGYSGMYLVVAALAAITIVTFYMSQKISAKKR